MKRKILTISLCLALSLVAVYGASCALIDGIFGGGEVKRDKSNAFIRVMNGVFESADYSVVESLQSGESSSGGKKTAGYNSGVQANIPVVYAEASPSLDASARMESLVDKFIGNSGIPLTDSNEKAIKGEALSDATGYSGIVKALMAMYGDEVFEKNYTYSNVTFSVSENAGVYTLIGVHNREGGFSSGIIVNFAEKGGEYSLGYAQYALVGSAYESNGVKVVNTSSEIEFAYYNSAVGAMRVELGADGSDALYNYDNASDKFEVTKILACSFDLENYVADDIDSSTQTQSKEVLSFVKDVLGFNNQTVTKIKNVKSTGQIKDDELAELNAMVESNYYVSPYYYQTNDSFVRESYSVPESVTVIKKGSIPATKVVYIHENVTKIESMPFEQPQYLEEIVFLNPDGGKLTQIGSFDQTANGRPTFILSMTKVKNFTLPKTVKKLELGDYVVNTVVEKLDLSNYSPNWINDKSNFTYEFKQDDFYQGMQNYSKETYRNKAYVTLNICGGTHVPYKEVRYINELYMPQFNMGITFDTWYEIQLGENGNTVYAFDYITKVLQATEMPYSEWLEKQNYTLSHDVIGKLYINDINTIVSEELLYGDFSSEDKYGKGEEYEREDFAVTLYDDETHSDFSHGDSAKPSGQAYIYSTIKEIIVSSAQYNAVKDEVEDIFEKEVHSIENLINERVKVTKK